MMDAIDNSDPDLKPRKPNVHAVDIVAVIAGVVPFAVPYNTTTTSGVETGPAGMSIVERTETHEDYAAIGGGAAAVLFAIIGLALIGRMGSRPLRLGIFIVLLALGGFQIIRGVLAGQDGGTRVKGIHLGLVAPSGLEPERPKAMGFKPTTSTNSVTGPLDDA